MIVDTERNLGIEPPSVILVSNAPTEQEAADEMRSWAIYNSAAPPMRLARTIRDGKDVYIGTAYLGDTIVECGHQIYAPLKEELERDHLGEVIAIDILTRTYALGKNEMRAAENLGRSQPNAVVYVRYRHLKVGGLSLTRNPRRPAVSAGLTPRHERDRCGRPRRCAF